MKINLSVNGKPFEANLAMLPSDITLNTYIREHAGLTATKFMCQEGGCGVCVCAVTGKHPATGEVRTWAVNSCLTLLNTCAGLEITTSEGLGNKRVGYHSIQKRLAKMNGTQCGYCSPGIVMNMYALFQANGGKLTMAEIENAFGGNICRCTGYRPILDAMKSFAVDSNIEVPEECRDIEDLTSKTCPKTGALCSGSCHQEKQQNGVHLSTVDYADGSQWFWPRSLQQVFESFTQLKSGNYMLVAGNTAHGVYRRSIDVKAFIDLNAIPELSSYKIGEKTLTLGANLSLTEAMSVFKEAATKPGFEYCQQLWQHLDWIANVPVRNSGTLAGNLSIKHDHQEFPSDVYIVFEALDVKVVINDSAQASQTLSLSDYLKTPMEKKLITSFVLRAYPKREYVFDSYKIMPRAQNAHAYVNAAFLIGFNPSNKVVHSARICFGGINPDFTRAHQIEALLLGNKLYDDALLSKVFALLKTALKPDHVLPDAAPEYRQKLAYSLFYKFLLKHAPKDQLSAKHISGGELLKRPVSSGKQAIVTVERNYPITKPTDKLEGLIQTSGEASFANDLPPQHNQVWAAFVTAKKVGARVTKVDLTAAQRLPGYVAYLDAKDIPGTNNVGPKNHDDEFFPSDEELLLTDKIRFYNQPIGVIVAESNDLANRAAALVQLTYEGFSEVVLPTLKSVLDSACSQRLEVAHESLIKELKIDQKYDVKASGKLDLGLQYHFTMEPHTTVVVPFEGGLQVYSASQWMDLTQDIIANVLNINTNEVQVRVQRIGGGYGGKGTRCNLAACAAALAAYKLNRPVRFVQTLESIIDTIGKRWAFHCDYDFYVKNSGKIVGLRSVFYEDAGYLPNETPIGHTVLLSKNCYQFSDNYKLDGYMVFTDSPNNTACRAPGSVEGIAMIENILEHIAFETGVDPADVRLANLLPAHKMCEIMPKFLDSTKYRERRLAVDAHNRQHRWLKRGLGLCIMEYRMGYFGQFPAMVAIYHSDGTVIVSHGGIEMGQGMNTKVAQVVAHELGIPMEMVRFDGSNTVNGANAIVTGGSIGSECVCYAVRKCCNTLKERLAPIREELKQPGWRDLINEAYNRKINLIASDQCKQGDMDPYAVCALGLAQLELDVLTGNYVITRVDLLEDAGESLNPNVDIGQIEGAFMMGLGYWTTEQMVVDTQTGACLTNRTWTYKPPGPKDIPVDLRVEMLPNSWNQAGFMRSKATGEPAICLGVVVAFALQNALQSARDDAGLERAWVTLNAPMTPELLVLNAGTDVSMLKLK